MFCLFWLNMCECLCQVTNKRLVLVSVRLTVFIVKVHVCDPCIIRLPGKKREELVCRPFTLHLDSHQSLKGEGFLVLCNSMTRSSSLQLRFSPVYTFRFLIYFTVLSWSLSGGGFVLQLLLEKSQHFRILLFIIKKKYI